MKYEIVRERGRGGFGVVHEVKHFSGQLYARKTLLVPPTLTPEQIRPRFEREVRYQSAIKHSHVVAILDYDLAADPPWFIMPLAMGSLHDQLLIDRTLGGNPNTALFHILAGLEEIHRLGYCHRDLKPQNVLMLHALDGSIAYALSDFGLMAVGEDASSTLTGDAVRLLSAIASACSTHQVPVEPVLFRLLEDGGACLSSDEALPDALLLELCRNGVLARHIVRRQDHRQPEKR